MEEEGGEKERENGERRGRETAEEREEEGDEDFSQRKQFLLEEFCGERGNLPLSLKRARVCDETKPRGRRFHTTSCQK